MLLQEIIVVYSEKKSINTLCWQNEESLIIIADDTYSYQWALKD
jgi:hypothetical protein